MAVGQPAGASLVEKIDVFNEQAEERDDDLKDNKRRTGFNSSVETTGGFFHETHGCGSFLWTSFKKEGCGKRRDANG